MEPSAFFPILQGMLGGAASAGLFKGPIQTLEDWWYINFGRSTNEIAEKLRAKQSINIEAYKQSILEETSKINPEDVKAPDLKILGPALEASKYYVEEEPLRIMFAKLIAASMNENMEEKIHSSFVEILKQLSPLDASNLLSIHLNGNSDLVAQIKIKYNPGGYKIYATNLFLGNKDVKKQNLLSSSISNLERLGLIEITYQEYRTKESAYEIFKKTEVYQNAKLQAAADKARIDFFKAQKADYINKTILPEVSIPEITPGLIRITPFGVNFCTTCL